MLIVIFGECKNCQVDHMTHLQKYIKFTIVSNLSLIDIQRMCETSKYWYKMISMSDFWQFMLHKHYSALTLVKLAMLTMREWYWRIFNAGDIHVTNENWTENLKLSLTNICQISECGNNVYFVDVYEFYFGNQKYFPSNTEDIPGLTECYGLLPYTEPWDPYWISDCVKYENKIKKIDCLASVKSIHPN